MEKSAKKKNDIPERVQPIQKENYHGHIASSDYYKCKPKEWKYMQGGVNMNFLLTNEYQRMWMDEQKEWYEKTHQRRDNVDHVRKYVLEFKDKANSQVPKINTRLCKMKSQESQGSIDSDTKMKSQQNITDKEKLKKKAQMSKLDSIRERKPKITPKNIKEGSNNKERYGKTTGRINQLKADENLASSSNLKIDQTTSDEHRDVYSQRDENDGTAKENNNEEIFLNNTARSNNSIPEFTNENSDDEVNEMERKVSARISGKGTARSIISTQSVASSMKSSLEKWDEVKEIEERQSVANFETQESNERNTNTRSMAQINENDSNVIPKTASHVFHERTADTEQLLIEFGKRNGLSSIKKPFYL